MHWQGYAEFKESKTLSSIKKKLGNTLHVEPRKGNQAQAIDYCAKRGEYRNPDGSVNDIFVERGVKKKQGKRSDLIQIRDSISAGVTMRQIADDNFTSWVQYHRSFDKYKNLVEARRAWETKCIVLWGQTGTGKTATAIANGATPIMIDKGGFWHNYNGEDTVLIDEFDPSIMSRELFLQITDRYPMQINIKGGSRNWKPKTIYFTSNHNPRQWYTKDGEQDAAVRRRLTTITHLTDPFRMPVEVEAAQQPVSDAQPLANHEHTQRRQNEEVIDNSESGTEPYDPHTEASQLSSHAIVEHYEQELQTMLDEPIDQQFTFKKGDANARFTIYTNTHKGN